MDEQAFQEGEKKDDVSPAELNPKDQNNSSNVNVDDIPITKPKTFEELLEEEMQKGQDGGGIVAHKPPSMQAQTGTSKAKEFLKRKTTYRGIPQGKVVDKKYYCDNFEQPGGQKLNARASSK